MNSKRIIAWVIENFNLGDRRLDRALGEMVSGIVAGGQVSFASIGRNMSGPAKVASRIRRVFEFCHNPRVDVKVVQETLVKLTTGQCHRNRDGVGGCVTVAMDWHTYDAGAIHGLRISLMTGTRALPLIWIEVGADDLKSRQSAVEQEALLRLIRFGPDIQWLVLLDAGFRSPGVLKLLDRAGFYIVRTGVNLKVSTADRDWTRIGDLPVNRNEIVDLGWLDWNESNPLRCRLVVARLSKEKSRRPSRRKRLKRARRRVKTPGLCAVITNIPVSEQDSEGVIRIYSRRFEIEHNFRDIRNASYGMDMEHTHLKAASTYSRLLCVVAIGEAVLWLAGAQAKAKRLHLDLSPSRPKNGRSVISIRNIGRLCLNDIQLDLNRGLSVHLARAREKVLTVVSQDWTRIRRRKALKGWRKSYEACDWPVRPKVRNPRPATGTQWTMLEAA